MQFVPVGILRNSREIKSNKCRYFTVCPKLGESKIYYNARRLVDVHYERNYKDHSTLVAKSQVRRVAYPTKIG